MSNFAIRNNKVYWRASGQQLIMEAWGEDSLRVRVSYYAKLDMQQDWALLPVKKKSRPVITHTDGRVTLINGKIRAEIDKRGRLAFYNQRGELLLAEQWRQRTTDGIEPGETDKDKYISPLEIEAREFNPIPGGKYQLTQFFEARRGEKIYGMGQYQQGMLDLKGCLLELAQRNSQSSVPFMLSSLGYGFLWNNPAVGEVHFAANQTVWRARVTDRLDYWITAGDSPAAIEENYARATGTVSVMPEFATGFWQSKLRYRTQEEVLAVAREYRRRGLPLSVLVIDSFHWPIQGTWCFDQRDWPDPKGMVDELRAMGIELMVSIWPTVDSRADSFADMETKGLLVRTDRGVPINLDSRGSTTFFDPTNPKARAYVWKKIKKNYYDIGIRLFWLDMAEPEYRTYHFDNYRYAMGTALEVGNVYPQNFTQCLYDGQRREGQTGIVNLVRCAWAGSQRFDALAWSGDVHSSFTSLRIQVVAGLNMGLAGIPWWTTDIGGFQGGDIRDPGFLELLVRWFQWGVFCPVMRLHGCREPQIDPPEKFRDGVEQCNSGSANELWSFGERNYRILSRWLHIRERLRPYIQRQMVAAHDKGTPVMRPLFYDFPQDEPCWSIEDQYLFGPDILVAPVLEAGMASRRVYLPPLPQGMRWRDFFTGRTHPGGAWIEVATPIDTIPVFVRNKADIDADAGATA
ncbi:TIM-barrel domain-containing protein [Sodalis sp. RH22]|uniref:glycoside hydrolase family 31 protein n=1 Tax=unclassified Sodalis (in: enterobacteria) TaxID=2636512 RepID=UPI0039B60241